MKLIKYTVIAILGGIMSGCNLDQQPYDDISLEQAFSSIGDVRAWKVGMYASLRSNLYGKNMMISDIQSDLLNATVLATSDQHLDFHRWETLEASNPQLLNIWLGIYSAITDINTGLKGFETVKFENPEYQKELVAITGELHLARAYYNLYLATNFCNPYKESTAEIELGIPIQKETKIVREIHRSTLKETYNHILSDIEIAEKNLTDVEYVGHLGLQPHNTFFIEAVQMLKARTLLYMERWKEAYDVAKILMEDPDYPLVFSPSELRSMWYSDSPSETITQLKSSATEPPQANNLYLGHYAPARTPWDVMTTPWYVPSQWLIDLYSDGDWRKAVYFKRDKAFINNTIYRNVWVVNKYPGNGTIASNQFRFHEPKMFRIAEAYLIASEAAYHIGGDALTPLNKLKDSRFLDAVNFSGEQLYQEIKDERLREFAFEGMRMFDLKRWGEPVTRRNAQTFDFIAKTPVEQLEGLNRLSTDPKFTWGIPATEVKYLKSGQQNKGW